VALAVCALCAGLMGFHGMLWWRGMSTYEYVAPLARRKCAAIPEEAEAEAGGEHYHL
jgi:hypothetical protein